MDMKTCLGSSTARYGGERPDACFMEIDRKMCKVHGDDEMIKITARDQRKVITTKYAIETGKKNRGARFLEHKI